MNLKNKKIFVSGGAGVIGSSLVEKLLQIGSIVMVGDLKPRPKNFPSEVFYWQGDLNFISKEELISFEPQIFIHLAATFERSTETFEFWDENYHHNLNLSHYLMSCLKDSTSLERVVFASSYLIYNPNQYYFDRPSDKAQRLSETDPIYPRNLCGTAKLMHEMELDFFSHFNSRFTTVSARIFRVYGRNSRDIISRWIRSLLKGEVLTVYKPEGLFDYIYADEVAEGLIRLADNQITGIINLGNDNARRVSEVIDILKKHFPDMHMVSSDLDIPYEASQANMDKCREIFKWSPDKQLEDAIPEIIKFEKETGFKETHTNTDLGILITSVSKKIPLIQAVKKASQKLGNKGILCGGDIDSESIAKYFVDEMWLMPQLKDLQLEELIQFCHSRGIKSIIPTRDGELMYFAKNKEKLESKNIQVMISNPNAVEFCLDKLKFSSAPIDDNYKIISSSENIHDISSELYVVKERFGAGAKGIGLKLSKNAALDHANSLQNPIFQPYISGDEVSIDLYVSRYGSVKGVIVRSRDLIVDGESQITTTIYNDSIHKAAGSLARSLKLYGHIVFQAILNNDEIHFIECNCRFGGASTLSLAMGLDSFYWFLLECNNQNIEEYKFVRSAKEKKQVRYKADIIL